MLTPAWLRHVITVVLRHFLFLHRRRPARLPIGLSLDVLYPIPLGEEAGEVEEGESRNLVAGININ